jgi:hypothetical protein
MGYLRLAVSLVVLINLAGRGGEVRRVAPGESPARLLLSEVVYDPSQPGSDLAYQWVET